MRRLLFCLIALALLFFTGLSSHSSALAQRRHMRKYKPPPPMAQVVVTVLRNADGKPLQNAAVVFHPQSDGKNDGNMELKTDDEGKASLNIIPIGSKLLVQVIVPGYRTFGAEYDVPSDKKAITVRMKPPQEQYSIYESNNGKSPLQNNTPQTQMGHAAPTDSPLLAPAPSKH